MAKNALFDRINKAIQKKLNGGTRNDRRKATEILRKWYDNEGWDYEYDGIPSRYDILDMVDGAGYTNDETKTVLKALGEWEPEMVESPMRRFQAIADGTTPNGNYTTWSGNIDAINPSEADIMLQQKLGKKNDKYWLTGEGNNYDIKNATLREFQGPGRPISEDDLAKIIAKGKAKKLYQLDDGRSNWNYASERDMKNNPSEYWEEMDFSPRR